ncbi:CoA-transferase, partial [Pantoea ananatis]
GGCFFHHGDSFAMMRGGHLDICVMGAYQVSVGGDLANWSTGAQDAIPAVGGAMDLAIGARKVYVMMDYLTKKGECKLVKQCSYPLTGLGCVSRLYTDMAVIDITPQGPLVVECCPGLSFDALQALTPVRLLQPELATA